MTLATTRFTQALLDLEDAEPDVLFEVIPGGTVPLWPLVRMNLALAMSATEFTSVAVAARDAPWSPYLRAARSFLPSRWDAATRTAPRELVFVTGGVTTAPAPDGLRNWLVGDFADAYRDDAAILQWPAIDPRRGRPAFAATWTLDPLTARAEVRSRLRGPSVDVERIRQVVGEFARLLGGIRGEQVDGIVASANYAARIERAFDAQFEGVLDRLRPKAVIIDSPVDGGRGTVIAAMKRRGIHVVEPQHGWIGPGHGAYNFGRAMRRQELQQELPDELLTFGRYWANGLRFPGKITPIGKPQFERAVDAAPPLANRSREILVVSSVGDPERASGFVLELARRVPDEWSVVFRPHPSERGSVADRYPELRRSSSVRIDDRPDVYEALAAARIVVGVASTVLFEAAGMGCRVFVRETAYVPYITGDLFGRPLADADGIERVVAAARDGGGSDDTTSPDPAELWQPGAIENFRMWWERLRDGRPAH